MPSARTHYQLLKVDPAAEPSAIKAAFREQVARYHPDKVVHLGQEFQDLAAQRTAELTAAYQTLMSAEERARYDATLAGGRPAGHDLAETNMRGSTGTPTRFAAERAGGDDIVQRALVGRVRSVVSDLYGVVDCASVRGFEAALVPTASPPLMRSPFPRVFVRLRDTIDAAQVRDACAEATLAGLHVPGSPLNVLLFGKRLHDEPQILAACEKLRRDRPLNVAAKTHAVVIDAADWRAIVASDAPPALRRFIDRLRG
jgi:hypothetical protein